ncbi:phosphonopyruvate decarboxylase [Oligoflexus tunisiensis]|uniref:phosphonopyruvate decarboxylase n=1 Tax=Oligoflexus tunisiensis TaxID=708132 RepID=UPI000A818530|nr:phosphonopyruvate decarboxylase [Oligoflexus tunisiensis]
MDGLRFHQKLLAAGYEYFVGVPDSLLGGWISCAAANPQFNIATQEGEALSLAIGYYLATGKKPVVFLQNSGLGNLINPLMSMAHPDVYDIPILLLIGWRGAPGFHDEPQHNTMGQATQDILKACGITSTVVRSEGELDSCLEYAGIHALLIEPHTLTETKKKSESLGTLRISYLEAFLRAAPRQAALFATTGFTARELWVLQNKSLSHACFYSVGGMGFVSAIGLGFASFQPERWTCILDGDGAFLMHLGNAASIGARQPPLFLHIIFRNAVHESTGSQPLTALPESLADLGKKLGYRRVETIQDLKDFADILPELFASRGPILVEVRIPSGTLKDLPRPTGTPKEWLTQFQAQLS